MHGLKAQLVRICSTWIHHYNIVPYFCQPRNSFASEGALVRRPGGRGSGWCRRLFNLFSGVQYPSSWLVGGSRVTRSCWTLSIIEGSSGINFDVGWWVLYFYLIVDNHPFGPFLSLKASSPDTVKSVFCVGQNDLDICYPRRPCHN